MDPHGHYIDGEFVAGGESFESRNPATGETLAEFARGGPEQVERAVAAAEAAFEEWRERSRVERAEFLWEVHAALGERVDELGEVVTRECGKEIEEGRADVTEAAHMVEWAAGDARHPKGDVVPSEIPGKDAYMRRKPRGVVGCITPWNFPVAIPFWHMAITLVEGNTVVWKPSEKTPWCAQVVVELLDDAGLPPGVVNVVQGFGDAGEAVVDDDRVSTVVFTGSAAVGQSIAAELAGQGGRRYCCEMGGKNAVLVTDRADLDIAVPVAVLSSFKTTGQRCVSSERVVVHRDVYDEFRERFVDVAERVAVGNPLDEGTFMGPLVDDGQVETFREYNDLAREEGGEVLVDRADLGDAEVPDGMERGHWAGPFVYELDHDPGHRCLTEEVFGPHVAVVPYEGGVERGVEIHNDTPYGLAGAIVSEDYRQLNYFRDHAEVGLAYANAPCIGAEIQLPFGGLKRSGAGFPYARELIEVVTDRTAWTVNNDTGIRLAQGLPADIETEE